MLAIGRIGRAAAVVAGDVPSLPWYSWTQATIGNTGSGTLTVDAGSQFASWNAILGKSSGGTGSAVITGPGSLWSNTDQIFIGVEGSGTLTVEDGGQVATGSLYAALADLHGDGIIAVMEGAVLDGDLRFDASNGTKAVARFGSGGTLTVEAGVEYANANLGAGYRGQGTLTVAEGITVFSQWGELGYRSGSSGTATVTGIGSTWSLNRGMGVGMEGSGSLYVEAGGTVNSFSGSIASNAAATGQVVIAGSGSTWNMASSLIIGSGGRGTLRIESGGVVNSEDGTLGFKAGAVGEATITGAGSQWNIDYVDLKIGQAGNGLVRVEDGGLLNSHTSYLGFDDGVVGAAYVTGHGSYWRNELSIHVGLGGNGTLTVADGGAVSTGYLYAAIADLKGDGTINAGGAVLDGDYGFNSVHGTKAVVSFGTGGTLTVGEGETESYVLGAGNREAGTLSVAGGVAVASLYGYLGVASTATGSATVTGAGSKWTVSQRINVGISGAGTMRVEAGGRVTNIRSGSLGLNAGATGEAIITGAGSQWTNNGDFYIGNAGNGMLRVEAGGKFSCAHGRFADTWGTIATAIVTGNQSTLTMTNLGLGTGGNATLRVEAGGKVSTTSGYIAYGASAIGQATVTGVGSQWINSGTLTVGNWGDATLAVTDGGLVAVGGTLRISPFVSDNGFINMKTGGMLALRGDADGSLAEFLGLVDGTDAIRYWDVAVDSWTPLANANFGSDYTLEYLASGDLKGYTLLTVGSAPPTSPGDFDSDGDVDGEDFLRWQRGGSPDPLSASDLAAWKANYGGMTLASSYVPVPEPAAWVVASVCATALRRRPLRRTSLACG